MATYEKKFDIMKGFYANTEITPTEKVIYLDVDGTLAPEFWPRVGETLQANLNLGDKLKLFMKFGKTDLESILGDITTKAMAQGGDFDDAFRQRLELCVDLCGKYGLDSNLVKKIGREMEFLPGVNELFNYLKGENYTIILVTGGVIDVASGIAARLGGVYGIVANSIEYDAKGKATGKYEIYVNGNKDKVAKTLNEKYGFKFTVAIGDGSNDIPWARLAQQKLLDLFIAAPDAKESLKNVTPQNYWLKERIDEAVKILQGVNQPYALQRL
jgi:HAD superfamily phosphoserine phosphatase-like hydrolase